jgi:uroporphyrin-III C-methyltransferase / precorrin-2 dehydrogenase / sirohydrochlorin ferrochelatase
MSNLFPYFPVFLDLAGRSVVLLGADEPAASLCRALLASGASVSAFDTAPCDSMRALAPPVRLKLRRWRAEDFKGARLVVAAAAASRIQRARTAAHGAGASFHLMDAPDQSDLALGGVAARGALSVGVSAQGAPAPLIDAMRERLEQALPAGLSEFLGAVARARGEVERKIAEPAARERFWTDLGAAAFDARSQSASDWDALIAKRLKAASR